MDEVEREAEERDAPVGRKDGAVAAIPEDQRDDRDSHRRHDRAFVEAEIFVEQQLQRAIAAAACRGLETAGDGYRARREQNDQEQRFRSEEHTSELQSQMRNSY